MGRRGGKEEEERGKRGGVSLFLPFLFPFFSPFKPFYKRRKNDLE